MVAGDVATYKACGIITCQMLEAMRDAMVKTLDDPAIVADVLDEMTGHAHRMLVSYDYGVAGRLP